MVFTSLLLTSIIFSNTQAFALEDSDLISAGLAVIPEGKERNFSNGEVSVAHGDVDVTTLSMAFTHCNNILGEGGNSIHQRYFPSANNIVSIDVELRTLNLASLHPITINYYQGLGVGGPLLGSTSDDDGNFPAVGQPSAVVHFDFASPIQLVPNNPYTIELTVNDGVSDFQWRVVLGDVIPGDFECFDDLILTFGDYIFATYFDPAFNGDECQNDEDCDIFDSICGDFGCVEGNCEQLTSLICIDEDICTDFVGCDPVEGCVFEFDPTNDPTCREEVGGELLPVDTTALLVAGVQANALWLIPVIVAAIGIGIVIARKF